MIRFSHRRSALTLSGPRYRSCHSWKLESYLYVHFDHRCAFKLYCIRCFAQVGQIWFNGSLRGAPVVIKVRYRRTTDRSDARRALFGTEIGGERRRGHVGARGVVVHIGCCAKRRETDRHVSESIAYGVFRRTQSQRVLTHLFCRLQAFEPIYSRDLQGLMQSQR